MYKNKTPSEKIIIPAVICAVAVAAILVEIFYLRRQAELQKELSDLQNMQCAELTSKMALSQGKIAGKVTCWYDGINFRLCSMEDEKPIAYGNGTTAAGGGKEVFLHSQNISYDYDESTDYTGKIIQVTIDPATARVTLEWVQ